MKYVLFTFLCCFVLINASNAQSASDTLRVGYTYWWPKAGPFIGMCGEQYSLVFIGEIKSLSKPHLSDTENYTSQEGVVSIDKVLHKKTLDQASYKGQSYFTTNCFNESGLKVGDKVLIVCYSYEEHFSIPGRESILKITGKKDPLVKSLKKYITSNQNARVIEKDLSLWEERGFGDDLKQILECKDVMK
ncbi:hypothetical protein [Fulvivirga ligni]|uniref:hypothetical protein n=1 Tax=Fulvivirga ligni TaxID=2904246 RepID=UPI001F3370A9|nr:hypothetical protein [Fulvivirga ligni]UII23390.1 hypothetical protein LVD16_09140 [Fulvivirga ligni]